MTPLVQLAARSAWHRRGTLALVMLSIALAAFLLLTLERLRQEVDDVVCLAQPSFFGAIGYFYRDFHQLSDDEVITLMRQAPLAARAATP